MPRPSFSSWPLPALGLLVAGVTAEGAATSGEPQGRRLAERHG